MLWKLKHAATRLLHDADQFCARYKEAIVYTACLIALLTGAGCAAVGVAGLVARYSR